MKFFVDTAEVDDIRELQATGLLDGVTTNPSLIAKSGRDFKKVIAEICEIVSGPVSAEVAATNVDGMIAEGEFLAKIGPDLPDFPLKTYQNILKMAFAKKCQVVSSQQSYIAEQ